MIIHDNTCNNSITVYFDGYKGVRENSNIFLFVLPSCWPSSTIVMACEGLLKAGKDLSDRRVIATFLLLPALKPEP